MLFTEGSLAVTTLVMLRELASSHSAFKRVFLLCDGPSTWLQLAEEDYWRTLCIDSGMLGTVACVTAPLNGISTESVL